MAQSVTLSTRPPGLCEADVMSVARWSAANEAALLGHEAQMFLGAIRFGSLTARVGFGPHRCGVVAGVRLKKACLLVNREQCEIDVKVVEIAVGLLKEDPK
jgi:hypothetical protein